MKLSFPKVVVDLLKYFPHQHFKFPCVQIYSLLKTVLAMLLVGWDLSFLTRDWTPSPALEAQSPNRWTDSEVLVNPFFLFFFKNLFICEFQVTSAGTQPHTHTHTHTPSRRPRGTGQGSVCCAAGAFRSSISNITVCTRPSQSPQHPFKKKKPTWLLDFMSCPVKDFPTQRS